MSTAAEQQPYVHIPNTVSQEAQSFLRTIKDPALMAPFPDADDLVGWVNTIVSIPYISWTKSRKPSVTVEVGA